MSFNMRFYKGKSIGKGCPIKGFLAPPPLSEGGPNLILGGVEHNGGIPPPLKSVQNIKNLD